MLALRVIPALRESDVVPVLRQKLFRILADSACPRGFLRVRFLELSRRRFHAAVEEQVLAKLPVHDGLRPNLLDNIIRQIIERAELPRLDADIDGPPSAAACRVTDEIGIVRRRDEDALAVVVLNRVPVCRPERIILLADELLDDFHLRLLERCELGELDDPEPQQRFHGFLARDRAHGIRAPFSGKALPDETFSKSLRPHERQDVIELASRLHDAGNGGNERLSCGRPRELRILRAEIVDDERFQARLSIPFREAEQIIFHGIVAVSHEVFFHSVINEPFSFYVVCITYPVPQTGIIVVRPILGILHRAPRKVALQVCPVAEQVQLDAAPDARVIREHDLDIPRNFLERAAFRQPELRLPCGIIAFVSEVGEICIRFLQCVVRDLRDGSGVISCQFQHFQIGRHF